MKTLHEMIGKLVPRSIKVPLYRKWNSKFILDKEMIEDLTEFYNMSFKNNEYRLNYAEAIYLCKVAVRINSDLWNILNPKLSKS